MFSGFGTKLVIFGGMFEETIHATFYSRSLMENSHPFVNQWKKLIGTQASICTLSVEYTVYSLSN